MTRAIVILNKLIISPHVKEKNENMNDYQEVDLNQIHFLFLQKLPLFNHNASMQGNI